MGSLLAAVASYADARHQQGKWLLRIDNIDSLRVKKGAEVSILNSLDKMGFEWDEKIYYQNHYDFYAQQLDNIKSLNLSYHCFCSRKQLKEKGFANIYPGICRLLTSDIATTQQYAVRIKTQDINIKFCDLIQGEQTFKLENLTGDFILRRADKVYAYHLASVIDDYLAGVTHVVRGNDLLTATANQIYLQQLFNYPSIQYAHIPILVNQQGVKLSKSAQASEVKGEVAELYQLALYLGQKIDPLLKHASLKEFWQQLIANWDVALIPQQQTIIY